VVIFIFNSLKTPSKKRIRISGRPNRIKQTIKQSLSETIDYEDGYPMRTAQAVCCFPK
jgi:hypothetical protein